MKSKTSRSLGTVKKAALSKVFQARQVFYSAIPLFLVYSLALSPYVSALYQRHCCRCPFISLLSATFICFIITRILGSPNKFYYSSLAHFINSLFPVHSPVLKQMLNVVKKWNHKYYCIPPSVRGGGGCFTIFSLPSHAADRPTINCPALINNNYNSY